MNEELKRKIQIIGKLEDVNTEHLIDSILEKYIKEYTNRRTIYWSIFDKVDDTTSDDIIKIYKAWTDMLKKVFLWSKDEKDQRTTFEKWDDRCFEEAKREQQKADLLSNPKYRDFSKQIHLNRDNPTLEEWKSQRGKGKE